MITKTNILKYEINSSQGDLAQTISCIKNNTTKISAKTISTIDTKVDVPYFLLQKRTEEDYKSIYKLLKELLYKLVIDLTPSQKEKTAILIGSSQIDFNIIKIIEDTAYEYKKTPYYSYKTSIDSYAQELADEFGLNGFSMTLSTACTSSVNALLQADDLIKSGVYDYAVVIGLEIYSDMMCRGFNSMQLLSKTPQKPFDKEVDGFILGEGIAGVLIGEDSSPWQIDGGYSNSNSVNITAVTKTGDEFSEVMCNALEISNVKKENITALKAHGTSTITNDLAEINAISRVFNKELIFTAIKPYVGHTLGACGVLELAIFISCIDNGFIPKTLNHKHSLLDGYSALQENKECYDGSFMLNYFGFGGNNASIVITKKSAVKL